MITRIVKSVMDLNKYEFFGLLDDKEIKPEDVYANATRIYDYMGELFGEDCNDSILREQIFEWWVESTGEKYDDIYNRWLHSHK
jgi:hypothetical protein